MNNFNLHDFVIHTEEKIKSVENNYQGLINYSRNDWTMWLDYSKYKTDNSLSIKSKKVKNENDWNELFLLRVEIEKAFGINDKSLIEKFIQDIRNKVNSLNGSWYLIYTKDNLIGEFGLIPFELKENFLVGRLQDIDILPKYQSQGFGEQLLKEVCNISKLKKYKALCLMASEDNWPKGWYQRFGFEKLGMYKSN